MARTDAWVASASHSCTYHRAKGGCWSLATTWECTSSRTGTSRYCDSNTFLSYCVIGSSFGASGDTFSPLKPYSAYPHRMGLAHLLFLCTITPSQDCDQC